MNPRLERKLREKKAEDEARVEHLSTSTLESLVKNEVGLWRAAARVLARRSSNSLDALAERARAHYRAGNATDLDGNPTGEEDTRSCKDH